MEHDEVEDDILELEKRYWQAMQENDVTTALELTDFPCLVSGPQGIGSIDEQTFMQMMSNPSYSIQKVDMQGDAKVRLLRDDVAIVAYKVHEELTVDGKPVKLDTTDSSTWIRRDGQWLCALHAESVMGDPYGRDRSAKRPAETVDRDRQRMSTDERAIRELIDAWMDASRSGDVPKLLTMMTDDVIFMVPGRRPMGKEGFAVAVQSRQGSKVEALGQVSEIEVIGDWAWCRVHLTVTITPPAGTRTTRSGYALTVLRKQAGKWRIFRDANLMTPT